MSNIWKTLIIFSLLLNIVLSLEVFKIRSAFNSQIKLNKAFVEFNKHTIESIDFIHKKIEEFERQK